MELTERDVELLKHTIAHVENNRHAMSVMEILGLDWPAPMETVLETDWNSFVRRFREWDEER